MPERLRSLGRALALTTLFAPAALAQSPNIPVAQEFERLHFRSIGPAMMSGRISDLAIYEANPAIFYVATAHGGVWKTTSNGALMTPVLQDEGLLSIGDVTISQTNPDLVWVGKGESNNRQSTSWGDGVYKSTDGGRTWRFMGLGNSKHIGRILIDPANNETVLVGATGPLFGPGGDRGVYKTTNGGTSWRRTLTLDDETGVTDLAMSATDPRVIYAATYQRRRTTCCMNGGGTGSGLYKSVDGGETWTRISGNGWPAGPLGRIGIDTYRKDGNVIYASVEGPSGGRGNAAGAPTATTGVFRSTDGGASWTFMSSGNPRPMYFSQIRVDPNSADRIYMGGVDLWMSVDGGRNFAQNAASTIHDDIHAVWINPANSNHIVIGGDGGIGFSYDMSQTYRFLWNLPVGLFYHVNYDMEIPYNVCGGMQDNYNWCGPSASRNSLGIYTHEWFQVQGGDGFVAIPDRRDSRIIYSESQDGNIQRRNKVTGEAKNIRPSAANTPALVGQPALRWHWDTPFFISPNDNGVIYAAANRIFRTNDRGDSWVPISPDLTTNARRDTIVTMGLPGSDIRIATNDGISQWPAIVSLAESPKTPGILFAGTDDGQVSMTRDGGRTWENITSRLPGFPTPRAFVSEVVPSKFDAATVYITVDHHRENDYRTYMWVSNDAGRTFRSMNGNLTDEVVRTLTEDQKNPDVLYIGTESGIFVTLDRGQSWRRLKANLPMVRVDEITLHPRDNAMIVGTHGRAIWILDQLSPIQEYTAAQSAAGEGRLFSIPTAVQMKRKNDLNTNFWGHELFIGENPPLDAVIQFHVKSALTNPMLRIADSLGRVVRELAIPANRNQPGIQTVCWDMRAAPIVMTAAPGGGRGGAGAGGRGGAGAPGGAGGAAGAGRGGQPGALTFPDQADPGYRPTNICGGGGGGGFGGGGGAAPHVLPGRYNVSLVSNGRVLDTKPMTVIMDPMVKFTVAERRRYDEIVMGLHASHARGAAIASALGGMVPEFRSIEAALSSRTDVPAAVKTQFAGVKRDFESLASRLGIQTSLDTTQQAGGPGGRGGGRGGAPADTSALGRLTGTKNQIAAIWELPSDNLLRQSTDARTAVNRAVAEATTLWPRLTALSTALGRHNLTLTVPALPPAGTR